MNNTEDQPLWSMINLFQDVPNSFQETINSLELEQWQKAMQEEYEIWASGNWSQDQKIVKQSNTDGYSCVNLMADIRHG